MLKALNLQYRGEDIGSERGHYYEFSNDPIGKVFVQVITKEHLGNHLVVFMTNGRIIRED